MSAGQMERITEHLASGCGCSRAASASKPWLAGGQRERVELCRLHRRRAERGGGLQDREEHRASAPTLPTSPSSKDWRALSSVTPPRSTKSRSSSWPPATSSSMGRMG
jgi:hypothetical protein